MLKLAGIQGDSIVDGPGIRTVFFAQGCPHHCIGCHNPETWPFTGGLEYSTETLMDMVRGNPLCHAVTLSGGEPFSQAEDFAPLAEQLRAEGYEVASYSGYTFEELLEGSSAQRRLLAALNVLIDGPFIEKDRSLELNFRGSRNQRVICVPESLKAGKAILESSPRWLGEY